MSSQDIPSPNEALDEYFKLKNKFENEVNMHKRKIINNIILSKREKRAEFLKLAPKCVNCKRPSKNGTIFSTNYVPETDTTGAYRILRASCGVLADPCNLNIEIHVGKNETLDNLLRQARDEITESKNAIIDDKNKLLFGLITTEKALENFDFNKSYINDLTSVYELFLDRWNKQIENPDKKVELDESLVLAYENINKIKECIKKMNENNDTKFAEDAARIYVTTLKPLLEKIRHLKYSETMVYHDEYSKVCKLIQRTYTDSDMEFTNYSTKVIKYDIGMQVKKKKKSENKSVIILEDSDDEISLVKGGEKEIIINIKEDGQPTSNKEIPRDEPIIGQGIDGIDWHLDEYKRLWSKLPIKLKTEFKLNIDWMIDFMHHCLNAPIKEGVRFNGCSLTTPPNLIIPPKQTSTGQYDFGVPIYNIAFNKQAKSLQQTYLNFYKEDPNTKEKNYKMLEDAMNRLVESEVNFDKAFF
jgi:hypothetical protein